MGFLVVEDLRKIEAGFYFFGGKDSPNLIRQGILNFLVQKVIDLVDGQGV